MKLTNAHTQEKLKIVSIDSGSYQQRLFSMGMIEGSSISPLHKTDTSMLVDVEGNRYILGKEIADSINVTP